MSLTTSREEKFARTYKRSEDVTWEILEESAVILDLGSGFYYTLNEVGTRVWELSDGSTSMQVIKASLADDYDVDDATLIADLEEILDHLLAEKLIVPNTDTL